MIQEQIYYRIKMLGEEIFGIEKGHMYTVDARGVSDLLSTSSCQLRYAYNINPEELWKEDVILADLKEV